MQGRKRETRGRAISVSAGDEQGLGESRESRKTCATGSGITQERPSATGAVAINREAQ